MKNFHDSKIVHHAALKHASRKLNDMASALERVGMIKIAEELDEISDSILISFNAMDAEFGQHLHDEHDKALAGVGSILSALVRNSDRVQS